MKLQFKKEEKENKRKNKMKRKREAICCFSNTVTELNSDFSAY